MCSGRYSLSYLIRVAKLMKRDIRAMLGPLAVCLAAAFAQSAVAQNIQYAPDAPEPGSVEKIREYTTAPEYLPESVSYIPDSGTVPSPSKALGQLIGTPGELHRTDAIYRYFRKLAEKSPRVRVRAIGTSEEGREILLVLISSEENLREESRFTDITRRLADPRRTTRDEMRNLAAEGKALYYLTGGLHSLETGSPEMLMELAYRLAVSEKLDIKAIRDNTIVMITPVAEPDGRDRVVDWYYQNLAHLNLPYEDIRQIASPPYWGHYVFHDNNRDGLQRTLALTKAIHGVFFQYRPQVMHDLHESIPLLYISSGHGPYNRGIDPVTINEWTEFAHHETSALQSQGLPGVWTWGFWDGWSPSYLFSVANNHSSIGRFYETFGNLVPGTYERDVSDSQFAGRPVTDEQWYRPWPTKEKVKWSLRNNINYMQAGVLSGLQYAAAHREELLRNFWIKGDRSIAKGKTDAPHAWLFPQVQRDRRRLAIMLELLKGHDVELHRLSAAFTTGGKSYPAGSYLVRLDQPTRNMVINLMEVQKFPADEPNAPYDDVAWTFPLLQGVDAEQIDDPLILQAQMDRVSDPIPFAGTVSGHGETFLLQDTGQNGLLPARVMLGRALVEAAETAFDFNGIHYAAGSWLIRAPEGSAQVIAKRFGLDLVAVDRFPDVPHHTVDLPRLAVLHTWISTQDTGWVRYIFDSEKIPYTLISPEDAKRGRLNQRFDVILFPNTNGDFKTIVHDYDSSFGPLPYTRTAQFPSLGTPDASPDVSGGMGFVGLRNLDAFVRSGGLLITLANAGRLPVEGGITTHVDSVKVDNAPGSELRAKFLDMSHPISYGYDEQTSVFRGVFPLFDVKRSDRRFVVMQFGTKDVDATSGVEKAAQGTQTAEPLVLSGFVKEPKDLEGKPAILDIPTGKGRLVLFSFNPLHRNLNSSDFRLLYNVLLNWNDLPSLRQ